MELGSIGTRAAALPPAAPPRESEAAERAPDNEAAESARPQVAAAKAPLPAEAGNVIDLQA